MSNLSYLFIFVFSLIMISSLDLHGVVRTAHFILCKLSLRHVCSGSVELLVPASVSIQTLFILSSFTIVTTIVCFIIACNVKWFLLRCSSVSSCLF